MWVTFVLSQLLVVAEWISAALVHTVLMNVNDEFHCEHKSHHELVYNLAGVADFCLLRKLELSCACVTYSDGGSVNYSAG